MSYALRNTLAIGIVVLLTFLGGRYWTHIRMEGQLKKLQAVEVLRGKKLDELNQWIADYDTAQAMLGRLKSSWANLPKVILPESSTASVFAYLNDLMALDRSSLQFNFTFQKKVEEGEYGYGVYAVAGTGSFRNVYNLIWRIEHERPLVKIISIRMQEQKIKKEDRTWSEMQFEMALHAYHSRREMPTPGGTMAYDTRDPFVGYNPFYPLVLDELPPNTEGLVEVEGATLEAMTVDQVVIRDAAERRATLRIGDRVYLGRLRSIHPDAQRAVFVLNKGGIVGRVVLDMESSSAASADQKADKRTAARAKTVRFLGVETTRSKEVARVIIRNTGRVPYKHFGLVDPPRIVIDIEPAEYAWDLTPVKEATLKVEDSVIREIRASQFKLHPPIVRVVVKLKDRAHYTVTQRQKEIVVDIGIGGPPTSL